MAYAGPGDKLGEKVLNAIGPDIIPILDRWLGKTVDNANHPDIRGLPPIPIILQDEDALNVMDAGVCGRSLRETGTCPSYPDEQCYICPAFVPYLDADHQASLDNINRRIKVVQDHIDKPALEDLLTLRNTIQTKINLIELKNVQTNQQPPTISSTPDDKRSQGEAATDIYAQ